MGSYYMFTALAEDESTVIHMLHCMLYILKVGVKEEIQLKFIMFLKIMLTLK